MIVLHLVFLLPFSFVLCSYEFQPHLRTPFTDFPTESQLEQVSRSLDNGEDLEHAELVSITENRDLTSSTLVLNSNRRKLSLRLKPSYGLITRDTKFYVHDVDGSQEKEMSPSLMSSFFHGHIGDHEKSSASLMRTNDGWWGLLETAEERFGLHIVKQDDKKKHLLLRINQPDLNTTNGEFKMDYNVADRQFLNQRENRNHRRIKEESVNQSAEEREGCDNNLEVELGIYADDTFLDYIRTKFPTENTDEHAKNIILLTANTVFSYYQHPSIGYKLRIVVAQIHLMKTMPPSLEQVRDVSIYRKQFCKWNHRYENPSGSHYDLAILFTALDLYLRKPSANAVAGQASLGTMCIHTTTSNCVIVELKGVMTGNIAAHEVAHALGVIHDGDGNDCSNDSYVMSPYTCPSAAEFSTCSRKYLVDYIQKLDDFNLNCLRSRQASSTESLSASSLLPGESLTDNEQCSFLFGKDWIDDYTDTYFCGNIACKKGKESQYAKYSAPLQGTRCGDSRICYNGECKDKNEVYDYIKNFKRMVGCPSQSKMSVDSLCKKYMNSTLIGVESNGQNLYSMCDNGMMCREPQSVYVKQHYFPAPPGTPCSRGKVCKNFECQ